MAPVEFTLQQLAQMALGAPKLNNVSIGILHSLIDLLLKKLNCQEERISIGGIEAKCLQKLLEISKGPPLAFNDEQLEITTHKIEQVLNMKERLQELNTKVEKHFEAVRQASNAPNNNTLCSEIEQYASPTEDLCTLCEPENEIACRLLQNADFMKKLLRYIAAPMVERMFEFETKIQKLHDALQQFIERAERDYTKIDLIDACIMQIEGLRKQVDNNFLTFIGTMEEIQDMLDAKVDKIHLPALKKYIKDNIERLEKAINFLQTTKDCPKAAGIIMQGVKCLSCGGRKVCAELDVNKTAMLPSVKEKHTAKQNKYKNCACDQQLVHPNQLTIQQRMAKLDYTLLEHKLESSCSRLSTRSRDVKNQMIEGFNGSLYRKG